jgi:DNA-binding NtrC family response regulator
MTRGRILIVDADAEIREDVQKMLRIDGYEAQEAASCRAAIQSFEASRPDALVVAARLPDGTALDILAHVKRADAGVACVVLARYEELDVAVQAIQEGAEQFLTKPVQLPAFLLVVDRVLENQRNRRRRLQDEAREAREEIDPFLGSSPAMRLLRERAQRVAGANIPVLIRGETGTGKGVLAAWIHRHGPRSEESFLDLNCAGLSPEFLESKLFGHEKGAFTSAVATKLGLLEVAHKGTLFLDEIGDVPLSVQPKLLKVLEEKKFRRLGDVRERQVDIRLIAASHENLDALVEKRARRKTTPLENNELRFARVRPPRGSALALRPLVIGRKEKTMRIERARQPRPSARLNGRERADERRGETRSSAVSPFSGGRGRRRAQG